MIRVLCIEPEADFAAMLASYNGTHLALTTWSPGAARGSGDLTGFDLVVVNVTDVGEALELVRTLKMKTGAPIVVMADEDKDVVLPYLEAGAHGYIPRHLSPPQVLDALESIRAGKPYFAPEIGTALVKRMHELAQLQRCRSVTNAPMPLQNGNKLSPRELEILALLTNGMSNQAIANELTIEVGTVKNHVHNILKKLRVSNRNQAAQYYLLLSANRETSLPDAAPAVPGSDWEQPEILN